jgi:DNA-binding IclR family transcriptional regulator
MQQAPQLIEREVTRRQGPDGVPPTPAVGGHGHSVDPKNGTVIDKVRAIVEVLGEHRGPVGLSELSRESGLAKASVHRLCLELVDWGIVERVDRRFRLGAKLFDLGTRAPSRRELHDQALPHAVELYTTYRTPVAVSVLDGVEVLCIAKITGSQDCARWMRVGTRMPAHCTSAGKAILAFSPGAVVAEVMRSPLKRVTPYSIGTPNALLHELVGVRRAGVSFIREEVKLGSESVAAPIFGPGREVVGAMSVTVRSGAGATADIVAGLKRQAESLSATLQRAS